MLPGTDTIAALSTAPGKGAIAVIRVSGPLSWKYVLQRTRLQPSRIKSRHFYYATYYDENEGLDDVVLLFFAGPDSFTGEDVVEIQCHGSPYLAQRILESCFRSGARSARPGEFSYRAVLNGKMDLTQAEGIRDLIESKTALQSRIAREMISGRLADRLAGIREELILVACQMETSLEFVEEDLTPESRSIVLERTDRVIESLGRLRAGYQTGRLVKEGVSTVLAGTTNTGKSLIFNALSEEDRAIVTSHAGTTRDVIVEELNLEGIPFILHDTAGIRKDFGEIEGLGVAKSVEHFNRASLILFVLDNSREWSRDDQSCWEQIETRKVLLVINKVDLPDRLKVPEKIVDGCLGSVRISALRGWNLDGLIEAMIAGCNQDNSPIEDSLLISNARQKECLDRTLDALGKAREAIAAGFSEEYPLQDIRKALEFLGQMTGEVTSNDILDQVFSTFCIGK